MGNAMSQDAMAAPVQSTFDAMLRTGFFHGKVWDLHIVPMECGMAIDASGTRGFVRLSSWVRVSGLYPIALSLTPLVDGADHVRMRATVDVQGVGMRGWSSVTCHQTFDGKLYASGVFDGVWTRNEQRTDGGSHEQVNTAGTFSLAFRGTLQAVHWEPRTHKRFAPKAGVHSMVRTLLLCHHRSQCVLSWLPKDVLFLIVKLLVPPLAADLDEAFERLMVDDASEETMESLRRKLEYGAPVDPDS